MADTKTPGAPRRSFLQKAAVGAVATGGLAAPMISKAQTVNLRFQSTWPAKDIFHEYAADFAKKVNDMAGGRLKIEVLPAGSVGGGIMRIAAVGEGRSKKSRPRPARHPPTPGRHAAG